MTETKISARAAILAAFNRLALSGAKPRVADVLGEAGVARSTFYEHFNSRDTLLLAAVRAPLGVIADAAAGIGDEAGLAAILDHFAENRRRAADLLTGPLGPRIVRTLADLITERDAEPNRDKRAALHLADMQIGFIRLWLKGETPYATRDLAALMIRSAAAGREVMRNPN